MKRLTVFILLLFTTVTYSRELLKVIDIDYVLENYNKAKVYNGKLKKDYDRLSKKYKVDVFSLELKEIKNSQLKNEVTRLKKQQMEYLDEINEDLMIAIFINYPEDIIFPIETILTGKTLNISDKILKFLNDVYEPLIKFKKDKIRLDDYIID
ncbi:hypothetical protein [Fusobacterium sp. MFO224]|uniref:hypothetical protein n=1 Tax=Fusobacterium sp. MFO224 TaxID=3378070 RepID=UPI003852CD5E